MSMGTYDCDRDRIIRQLSDKGMPTVGDVLFLIIILADLALLGLWWVKAHP